MSSRQLSVHPVLAAFVKDELLDALDDITPEKFWEDFEMLLSETVVRNKVLLEKRQLFEEQIDKYTLGHKDDLRNDTFTNDFVTYLKEIGYLMEEPEDFKVTTSNVDEEVREVCGAQLVVPVNNARYALNAANARWGSLFDALYFTDAIPFAGIKPSAAALDDARFPATVAWMDDFLDSAILLSGGVKHSEVVSYSITDDGELFISTTSERATLADSHLFVGYNNKTNSILFKHHDLHLQLVTDPQQTSMVGKAHHANLQDIRLEAAVSIIQDCEDSVAAVDAEDKSVVYRNWLGINKGDLSCKFMKGGREVTRVLEEDKYWTSANKSEDSIRISGRALSFVRNVGIHMYTDVVRYNGEPIPEGILDAFITTAAALHDLRKDESNQFRNSKKGSVYIVKPKLHGPEEVEFVCDMMSRIEDVLHLSRNTIKIGIMDEERRTTVNLKECIRIAKERVVFINTGFLDRVGDEIHTIMESGAVRPKAEIKNQNWLKCYEKWNVDIGLETGLPGHGLIGKGMWAIPDNMSEMLNQKISHLQQGASCAWVPSPTAATLHSTHYHRLYVKDVQKQLQNRKREEVGVLVTPEPWDFGMASKESIEMELRDNIQGLMGYVVRWVNHGIGCSKVPNIHHVGLMEDRATLRISSQLLANWLHQQVIDRGQVDDCLVEMSQVVDQQNSRDKTYIGYNNQGIPLECTLAFKAAKALILNGVQQLNGYTESVLHSHRIQFKASNQAVCQVSEVCQAQAPRG